MCSLDRNLLPPVEEAEIVPLSALPQGCSDEGLLFSESDIVLLFSFGSKFGKLICFFISWKTTVGWDPLQDYSSVLCDLMKAFCKTREFVSCCGSRTESASDRKTTC